MFLRLFNGRCLVFLPAILYTYKFHSQKGFLEQIADRSSQLSKAVPWLP